MTHQSAHSNDSGSSKSSIHRYRVVIVEDHTIVRQGLVALLSTSPEIEVVADVGDGLRALEIIERYEPDVLLCDLAIPGLGGVEVITRASALGIRPIALSMHHDGVWVNRAIEAGAWGYLVKGSGVQDVIKAILAVGRGERFLSPTAQIAADRPQLTTREREILTFVAQGHTSKEISSLLSISPRTVEHHRANMMEKLGINDVAGLTRYAVRQGIIDPQLK
jgi:DNA-binding NarL/FixJ family response regulator